MSPLPIDVTLVHRDGQQSLGLVDAVCDLYDAVFSQPPYDWGHGRSADHRRTLERLLTKPSFGLATAQAAGQLVGFGYGVALEPDTHWWHGATQPLPDDLTAEWPGRTFAVIDLGVRLDRRRQELGRALLDTLLTDRGEARATLAVEPTATEAQAFYRRLGWHKAGRVVGAPTDTAPLFDLYLLPLDTTP